MENRGYAMESQTDEGNQPGMNEEKGEMEATATTDTAAPPVKGYMTPDDIKNANNGLGHHPGGESRREDVDVTSNKAKAVNVEIEHEEKDLGVIYKVDEYPPWYLWPLLGFQHYLTMFGATIALPLILSPALCITDAVHTSELISTVFFVSGMITVLQVILGVRLPIVQGGTFAFLIPAFSILNLPQWQCPDPSLNAVANTTGSGTLDDSGEIWTLRMRELQGAIIGASAFQVVIGGFGLVGPMLQFIGPIVIAPTIALIGLSLFQASANFCASNWWIALMTIVFITIFSQYLNRTPQSCTQKRPYTCTAGFTVFKLFPIILAILLSWLTCYILTVSSALPEGDGGRTDIKSVVLQEAKWFRFPYPGQWGAPTFSTAAVFGMLSGVLAGMIESIGDYYACARLSGAPPPPVHAINRGVMVEGIGCVLAGLWGTGTGTTSYSENIGAIGITKVGSRIVVISGALLMLVFGAFGKFGALFVTIPDPIIGGVFMTMFGMITAVGISNLQFVDLNSSRNLFIFGFALFFGLSLPQWMSNSDNTGAINTGVPVLDQIFTVLLSTSMFVGGTVAFILDNTVPGTEEERGIKVWKRHLTLNAGTLSQVDPIYDLPLGMSYIRQWQWTRFIPLCPTFTGFCSRRKAAKYELPAEEVEQASGVPLEMNSSKNDFHKRKVSNNTTDVPVKAGI